MNSTNFTATNAREIAARVTALLAPLEAELGVKISYKGGTLAGSSCALKFEFAAIGADGEAATIETQDFREFAGVYGLKPEDLGQTLTVRGTAYKVIGLKMGSPRFPVLVERLSDGKGFKLPSATVASVLRSRRAV